MERDILKYRRQSFLIFIIIMAALAVGTGVLTQFRVDRALTSFPRAFSWLVENFVPDEKALENIPKILNKLWETVFVAILATMSAAVLSFFFAIMGSRTTRINSILSTVSRIIASLFRNIPVAAWAMIFLFSFNQSTFTGFLALFFVSFGFQTRVFMEAIDETAQSSVEALRATGAGYFHTIIQSVLPESLPQLLSWILFTIETNIRSATLVGILTGTGIGFSFDLYYKSGRYPSAALVVIAVVVVVLVIELISNKVRKAIL